MRRRNTQLLGEVLKDFFDDHTELYEKILEIRIQRAWGEVLGPAVLSYTTRVFVKNHVLHVSLTSAALRNELMMCRDRLVKSLNEYARATVIHDIHLH